ncbi:PREDICTED: endocuticle structural glycoprotein SgAbd-5-like [Nicrophorus vespilloides]|uniref:Endocuticle structural glycoprotein SgAbd-5-like n=1 Tax=Nicrophorus vespilloides TaxID=110193 RepID=A0ABM1NFY2_NICVS|nr:PREDICTED: endocuticle structural glycoprotein SgAbd-5-like [Nicrophorus vespilloides]
MNDGPIATSTERAHKRPGLTRIRIGAHEIVLNHSAIILVPHEILVLCFVTICYALPPSPFRSPQPDSSKTATILQNDFINAANGYNFAYQTSDGVQREEKAELKNAGAKDESLVVSGSYSYVGADGVTYTVTYIADENGYRPTGEHIPSL